VIIIASIEQLRKVALYCDKYDPQEEGTTLTSNTFEEKYENCVNCSHFVDGKCNLNLIDKILSTMAMENDLKS